MSATISPVELEGEMAVDPLFAVGIVEAHILDSEADRAGKLDTATDLLGLELEEMRQTIQRALRSDSVGRRLISASAGSGYVPRAGGTTS